MGSKCANILQSSATINSRGVKAASRQHLYPQHQSVTFRRVTRIISPPNIFSRVRGRTPKVERREPHRDSRRCAHASVQHLPPCSQSPNWRVKYTPKYIHRKLRPLDSAAAAAAASLDASGLLLKMAPTLATITTAIRKTCLNVEIVLVHFAQQCSATMQ